MLQTIRDHTQGWIAGVIIGVIILTFALWGIHSYFVGGGSPYIAEVNGTEISKEQLNLAYERLRKQIQYQYGGNVPADLSDARIRDQALRGLIELQVLKDAALKDGFKISDKQVDQVLQTMPEFQVDGQFSLERFQAILSSAYLSVSEFLNLVGTSLLIDQPRLGVAFSSFALPNEITANMSLVNQERTFDYLIIPLKSFFAKMTNIPQKEIEHYYNSNIAEFTKPEEVSIDYLELNLANVEKTITPTEQVLQNFYEENKNAYTTPRTYELITFTLPTVDSKAEETAKVQKQAEDLAVVLKKENNADQAAKTFHANVKTERLSAMQMSEEMKNQIETAEPNTILGPFKIKDAFIISKLVDVKAPQMQPYANVQETVKENYLRQQAEERLATLRDRLADLTYEHPDSLQFAADELKLSIQSSEVFTKEKVGKDISQHKKVRQAAFAHDVINLQNNSDVIQLGPNQYIVLRIKTHTAAAVMPLAQVMPQINERLKLKAAEQEAQTLAQNLVKELQSGKDISPKIQTYQLSWMQTPYTGRNGSKVDSALLDMAFRLPNPNRYQNHPSYGVAKVPDGYAVLALKSVREGDKHAKEYNVYAEQVQNSDGMLEYELYKNIQMARAKIKVQ